MIVWCTLCPPSQNKAIIIIIIITLLQLYIAGQACDIPFYEDILVNISSSVVWAFFLKTVTSVFGDTKIDGVH